MRGSVTAAAGVMAAAGLKAGADWDKATKTIVAGTGATGKQLQVLQKDYQAVARFGSGASTAVADLNTHLGLQGKEMREVAAAALKMGVNTNLAGDVMSQLGLDADGAVGFLDDLQASSQATGVSADQLLNTIGKSSARFQAAGGSVEDLTALVVAQAHEFGPAGLRGAMSEVMREVDKGVIPTVASLRDQLGETTGAVERTYQAGKTWRDVLAEQKDAAIAYLGPGRRHAGRRRVARRRARAGDPDDQEHADRPDGAEPRDEAQPHRARRDGARHRCARDLQVAQGDHGVSCPAPGTSSREPCRRPRAWLEPLMGWFGGSADEVARLSDELAGHSLTTALAAVNKARHPPPSPTSARWPRTCEDVQAETRAAINDFVTLKGGVQGIGGVVQARVHPDQRRADRTAEASRRNIAMSTGPGVARRVLRPAHRAGRPAGRLPGSAWAASCRPSRAAGRAS